MKLMKKILKKESNTSEKYVEANAVKHGTVELTPNVPKAEVEVIADDSLDEPVVVVNDEIEIIDDSVVEEVLPVEELPIITSNEVEIIETTPQEQLPIEEPNYDLGTRIGGDEKKQNVDLGVQLF